MIRTFNNIISDISGFCYAHNQINEFSWGALSNITTKDHNFVMVWLQPVLSSISGHLMTLSFDMYVMDIVKQDLSNLKDVMNDTLLIGNDIVSKFWSDEETYGWTLNEQGITMEPFDARFDDYTAGWVFRINIEIENRLNSCAIPESKTAPETIEYIDFTIGCFDASGGLPYPAISGAAVMIYTSDGTLTGNTQTDAFGSASFLDYPVGVYNFRATTKGGLLAVRVNATYTTNTTFNINLH